MIRVGAADEGHRQVDRTRAGDGLGLAIRRASVTRDGVAIVALLISLDLTVPTDNSFTLFIAGRSFDRAKGVGLPVVTVFYADLHQAVPAPGVLACRRATRARAVRCTEIALLSGVLVDDTVAT